MAFLIGGAAYWEIQIDDVFISLGYSHQWVDTGTLQWTSGATVEGYSNFLTVALGATMLLAGMDPSFWLKVASLGAAFWTLLAVQRAVAPSRSAWLPPLGLALWTPFAYWGVNSMETMLFTALLSSGWAAAAMGERRGTLLLTLSCLVRPEGIAHWCLALLALPQHRRNLGSVVLALGVLCGYHALRVAHFGDWAPTPFLVKLAAPNGGLAGALPQIMAELLTACGCAAALLATVGRLHQPIRALAPLALQCGLLASSGGDWMAWGRFLLPGVAASMALGGATSRGPHPRHETARIAAACLIAVAMFAVQPTATGLTIREWAPFRHPTTWYGTFLPTTLSADTEFLVENAPSDITVMMSDVGMPGQIPHLRVRDSYGLVDRAVAEERAGLRQVDEGRWLREYGPSSDQINALRLVNWNGGVPDPLPEPWVLAFPFQTVLTEGPMTAVWYRTWQGRAQAELAYQRWRTLSERFPSQWWLTWHRLLSEVNLGANIGNFSPIESRTRTALDDLPTSLTFTTGQDTHRWVVGRGFLLARSTSVESGPWPSAAFDQLQFDVDCPGTQGALAVVEWSPPCGEPFSVHVRGPTTIPAHATCAAPPLGGRMRVSFGNDDYSGGCDRNLYVAGTW